MQPAQIESLLTYSECDGVSQPYDASGDLRKYNTVLYEPIALRSEVQLAVWSDKHDTITQYCGYHTLGSYIADSYESYHRITGGWKSDREPDRFCLVPRESGSSWDIHDDLFFVYPCYMDTHLRKVSEKV